MSCFSPPPIWRIIGTIVNGWCFCDGFCTCCGSIRCTFDIRICLIIRNDICVWIVWILVLIGMARVVLWFFLFVVMMAMMMMKWTMKQIWKMEGKWDYILLIPLFFRIDSCTKFVQTEDDASCLVLSIALDDSMNSFSGAATFIEEAYVESKHRITNSEWKQSLLFVVMFILYARNSVMMIFLNSLWEVLYLPICTYLLCLEEAALLSSGLNSCLAGKSKVQIRVALPLYDIHKYM